MLLRYMIYLTRSWNHFHQMWSWYGVFINHGTIRNLRKKVLCSEVIHIRSSYIVFMKQNLLRNNQKCLKGIFDKSQMKPPPSNMVLYTVFIKHIQLGDNHLTIFKNSFWKEIQNRLLYPYFNSSIPAVFYTVKICIF